MKRVKFSDLKKKSIESGFVVGEAEEAELIRKGLFRARVVEVHKRYSFVSPEPKHLKIETEDVFLATVAKKYLTLYRQERNFLSVGDVVFCRFSRPNETPSVSDLESCSIEFRTNRQNRFMRLDPGTEVRGHVIAANINQIAIIASILVPEVKWGLLDRFLVLAEEEGVDIVIVLTKSDLLLASQDEKFAEKYQRAKSIYEGLGYQIIEIQSNLEAKKNPQLKKLTKLFRNKLTLLSGHSGVGKSSLVNLLGAEMEQEVEENPIQRKGRHTTSFSRLLGLDAGGYIIDTPGVRSFSLPPRSARELSWCFREMRQFLDQCRFRECTHRTEPKCSVLEAVENGFISQMRYKSYLNLLEELNS